MNQTKKTHRNFPFFCRDQSGAVALILSVLAVLLLCFVALGVDIGHVMVVRNELQSAADAAALAGAQKFYSTTPTGFTSTPPTPDWAAAEAAGSTNAPANKSDGVTMTVYNVKSGYWNLNHTPKGLQSQSITPGPNDVPGRSKLP